MLIAIMLKKLCATYMETTIKITLVLCGDRRTFYMHQAFLIFAICISFQELI
jgi:hypothetical protein